MNATMDGLESTKLYLRPIQKILDASNGIKYVGIFFNPDPTVLESHPELFQTYRSAYALSLLERSHCACIATLARSQRWLIGTIDQRDRGNLLPFAACLRGLLEASADSHDILQYLPKALVDGREFFYRSLHAPESVKVNYSMGQLEDRLIHFGFARRNSRQSSVPPSHFAKPNADYIKQIESFGVPDATKLYAELCELTHPASPSVDCFINAGSHSYQLDFNKDEDAISAIIDKYSDTIIKLTMFTLNPALICLGFITRIVPQWPGPDYETVQNISFAKNFSLFDELATSIGRAAPIDILQQDLLDLMTDAP